MVPEYKPEWNGETIMDFSRLPSLRRLQATPLLQTSLVISPSSNIGDITGHWTLRCTCSTPIIQVNISEICIINKTRVILCLTMYVIFISFYLFLFCFSLLRTEGFENLQQMELQTANLIWQT